MSTPSAPSPKYLPGWRGRVVLNRRKYAGQGLDKRQQRGLRRRHAKTVWLAASVYATERAKREAMGDA